MKKSNETPPPPPPPSSSAIAAAAGGGGAGSNSQSKTTFAASSNATPTTPAASSGSCNRTTVTAMPPPHSAAVSGGDGVVPNDSTAFVQVWSELYDKAVRVANFDSSSIASTTMTEEEHKRRVITTLDTMTRILFGLDGTKKSIAVTYGMGSIELAMALLRSTHVLKEKNDHDDKEEEKKNKIKSLSAEGGTNKMDRVGLNDGTKSGGRGDGGGDVVGGEKIADDVGSLKIKDGPTPTRTAEQTSTLTKEMQDSTGNNNKSNSSGGGGSGVMMTTTTPATTTATTLSQKHQLQHQRTLKDHIIVSTLKTIKCCVIRNKSGRVRCRSARVFDLLCQIVRDYLNKKEIGPAAVVVEEVFTTLAAICLNDDLNSLQGAIQMQQYIDEASTRYPKTKHGELHQKITYLNALFDTIRKEQEDIIRLLSTSSGGGGGGGSKTDNASSSSSSLSSSITCAATTKFFDAIAQAEKEYRFGTEAQRAGGQYDVALSHYNSTLQYIDQLSCISYSTSASSSSSSSSSPSSTISKDTNNKNTNNTKNDNNTIATTTTTIQITPIEILNELTCRTYMNRSEIKLQLRDYEGAVQDAAWALSLMKQEAPELIVRAKGIKMEALMKLGKDK